MANCLSANECDFYRTMKIACDVCQLAEKNYVEREREKAISNAIRVLKAEGYTITEPVAS